MTKTHIPTNAEMVEVGYCPSSAQKKRTGERGVTVVELVLMADQLEIPMEPLARELAAKRDEWLARRAGG